MLEHVTNNVRAANEKLNVDSPFSYVYDYTLN